MVDNGFNNSVEYSSRINIQRQLEEALKVRVRYMECWRTVQSKLEAARAELQLLETDSNPEHARDLLEQHEVGNRFLSRN